jgi:hypothetical protein
MKDSIFRLLVYWKLSFNYLGHAASKGDDCGLQLLQKVEERDFENYCLLGRNAV